MWTTSVVVQQIYCWEICVDSLVEYIFIHEKNLVHGECLTIPWKSWKSEQNFYISKNEQINKCIIFWCILYIFFDLYLPKAIKILDPNPLALLICKIGNLHFKIPFSEMGVQILSKITKKQFYIFHNKERKLILATMMRRI